MGTSMSMLGYEIMGIGIEGGWIVCGTLLWLDDCMMMIVFSIDIVAIGEEKYRLFIWVVLVLAFFTF